MQNHAYTHWGPLIGRYRCQLFLFITFSLHALAVASRLPVPYESYCYRLPGVSGQLRCPKMKPESHNRDFRFQHKSGISDISVLNYLNLFHHHDLFSRFFFL